MTKEANIVSSGSRTSVWEGFRVAVQVELLLHFKQAVVLELCVKIQ